MFFLKERLSLHQTKPFGFKKAARSGDTTVRSWHEADYRFMLKSRAINTLCKLFIALKKASKMN